MILHTIPENSVISVRKIYSVNFDLTRDQPHLDIYVEGGCRIVALYKNYAAAEADFYRINTALDVLEAER